jgi:hypothetical protein
MFFTSIKKYALSLSLFFSCSLTFVTVIDRDTENYFSSIRKATEHMGWQMTADTHCSTKKEVSSGEGKRTSLFLPISKRAVNILA